MSAQIHSRSSQLSWIDEFKLLPYSEMKAGYFCKYCILFLDNNAVCEGNHQTVGASLTKHFTNLKKAREMFKQHENSRYHKDAMLTADNIKSTISKKADGVINQLDVGRKKNTRKHLPIIQLVRLCSRQQISLRGKHDAGRINLHELINNDGNFCSSLRYRTNSVSLRGKHDARRINPHELINNDGNFCSSLRYRTNSGDLGLREHLESIGCKNLYTSSVIQNELILKHFWGFGLIQNRYRANKTKRRFSWFCAHLRRNWLYFSPHFDGEPKKMGLDVNKMRGQGYDGTDSMPEGEFRGVQAYVKEKVHSALHTHYCSAHSLNIMLAKFPLLETVWV
ncbi:hypothetical protein PR048_001088 [Dryococelus australis]|uniref:TTF-type domain-containing protein n=1 Tax=Dryococelus australis TaxID=614101 RepID=A0ABQ9IHV7_9NEOP|nr:hypothetical protein PR048_001088 [Dryococelus australis]